MLHQIFALLQLIQTPQPNSGINYSGWNRNANAPNGSVCLHHPEGDLMKFSRDFDLSGVSSWGGVNNHWVSVFEQGTVEPGSSGSPLYDMNHRIVGQLHGDQQNQGNYCAQRRGEYGRFDLSWAGGGTNATRLSNWLDPGNSGALTTNTTNISNLLAPNSSLTLNVTGSGNICSGSSTYTLTGAPTGVNITWAISNTSIASLVPNGTQATVTKTGNGNITLSATVAAGCSYTNNVGSKDIKLGAYSNYEVPISGYTQVPLNYTTTYSVDLSKYSITNLVWSWPSGWTYIYGGNGNNYIQLRSPATASTGDINLSFSACGVNNILSAKWVAWGYGGPSYRITPNPANSILKVEEIDSATNKALAQTNIQTIEIVDKMGNIVYKQNFSKGTPNGMTISVDKLLSDIYVVRIFNGTVWKSYKNNH